MSWIVIDDVRYDITDFMSKHPGGEYIIRSYCGLDATDLFHEFHSENAVQVLKKLPVLENTADHMPPKTESGFQKDIRALRKELEAEGLFKSSTVYYVKKMMELVLLLGASAGLLYHDWWYTSAFMLGLFFQQSGWLAHDFAHNQATIRYRAPMLCITGNLFQGFSGSWWISKHMLHHALPNALHETENRPLEEDFDTAPILYWTSRLLPKNPNSWLAKAWIRNQGYLLWVVLPFSKFMWDLSSIRVARERGATNELIAISTHYLFFSLYSLILNPTLLSAVSYFILARLWGGFLISWVFIQSHNAMEYYDRTKYNYYDAQIASTRNMGLGRISTWFTGGLNYQIEHHIFPRLPRHNLRYIQDRVEKLAKKHGFLYEVMDIFRGSSYLTHYLNKLGSYLKKKQE